jgi:hypothetical protein
MWFLRRKGLVVVGLVVAVVGGSVAYAAWLSGGSGSVTAKAGTAVSLTTSDASASTTTTLYPGVTGDARITINNPNAFAVRVTNISAGVGSVTATGGTGTCTTTGVSLVAQSGLALDVAANSSASFTVTGAVAMSNSSDDGCQGATFTVPVSLTGVSH